MTYDTLVTRLAMLSAIDAYIGDGGKSRGSFLIPGTDGIRCSAADAVQTDPGLPQLDPRDHRRRDQHPVLQNAFYTAPGQLRRDRKRQRPHSAIGLPFSAAKVSRSPA